MRETIPTIDTLSIRPLLQSSNATLKQWPGFLGEQHLPREVCRFTNYIIFHGGVVTAKAVDVNCLVITDVNNSIH